MTSFQTIYDAFLNEIRDDEYAELTPTNLSIELRSLLNGALLRIKFPKFSLAVNENGFIDDLTNDDIRLVASFMREVWLSHIVNNWENVKVLFDERDFSPANQLDKLTKLQAQTILNNERLQKQYNRTSFDKEGKKIPFDYTRLAGGRSR